MKRTEVQLGVEYCETGPLAYGAEPNAVPYRVRFSALHSAILCVKHEYVERNGNTGWFPTGERMALPKSDLRLADMVPDRGGYLRKADKTKPVWTKANYETGDLPCERWIGGQWMVGVCKPASIHRTWIEHEESDARRQATIKEARILRAPNVIRSNATESLAFALLITDYNIHDAEAMLLAAVHQAVQSHDASTLQNA